MESAALVEFFLLYTQDATVAGTDDFSAMSNANRYDSGSRG